MTKRVEVPALLKRSIPLAVIIVIVASLPLYASPYIVSLLFILFTFVGLALSYDVFGGYTGYYNLGYGGFFAIGGYTLAILTMGTIGIKIPLIASLFVGPLAAAFAAFILSYPFFRLRGAYFAVATFGLIPLFFNLARNLREITGGASGLQILGEELIGMTNGFYIALIMTIIASYIHYRVKKSKLGLALLSIGEDEDVASEYGVNVFKEKQKAFVISAALAGALGANFGLALGSVSPAGLLSLEIALAPVIMTIFGGPATLMGPILGAVVLTVIQETLWLNLPFFHLMTYGLIILIVAILAPRGIVNTQRLSHIFHRAKLPR